MKNKVKGIGQVVSPFHHHKGVNWAQSKSKIKFNSKCQKPVHELKKGAKAIVFTYSQMQVHNTSNGEMGRHDEQKPIVTWLKQKLKFGKKIGNPIGVYSVKILDVSKSGIIVEGLVAVNGTVVVDIKPCSSLDSNNNE